MDQPAVRSENKGMALRAMLFGSMCLLTLVCIAAAVNCNIFRDSYICMVNISNITGLIFVTLLSGFLFFKAKENTRLKGYYMLFLLNIFITAFLSSLANSLYLLPDRSGQIAVLNTMSYFSSMAIFLTLWLYQKQFLKETAVSRTVTALICVALLVYAAVLVTNLFSPLPLFITEDGGRSGIAVDLINIITDFFCLTLLCIAVFSSDLSRNRKISFLCCTFAPVMFAAMSVNHELLKRSIYIWGVLSLTVVLPLGLLFFNALDDLEKDVLRHEKEQIQLQISAMISQMQPHFLYNSLAVIAALCEENPRLAAEATGAFSDYLRENMDFADKCEPIPFSEELRHIRTYVWLEKLRFPNKLSVEYDIGCTSFPVPALSVQPMVENAIKHGICKTKSGGTVRIRSFETDRFYNITVADDGIGFDVRRRIDDGKRHLGIENSRYRIREMTGGSLDVASTPGEGTTVSIKIPKHL